MATDIAPVPGALGFAHAVSKKAAEIATMVWRVFMVVFCE
jgi:uncharacterized membrane protein YtjA (UPF0391 family)